MNGISSNLKEELKKTITNKTREKIRFFSAIIVTNIFVALICLPSSDNPKAAVKEDLIELHTGHKLLILPLTILLPIDQNQKTTPVTLISKEKKVLVKKAWLHNETLKDNRFKIEIPESEIVVFSAKLEEDMIAVPYVETKTVKVAKSKGSKYEVNL